MSANAPLAASVAMQGVPDKDVFITFDTDLDHALFQEGLNRAKQIGDLIVAWEVIYAGAAQTLGDACHIDCGDFYLAKFKGVFSPLCAILQSRGEVFPEDCPLDVEHVWVRNSQDANREDNWSFVLADGNPNGKGGSYRASIVGAPRDLGTYCRKVEKPKPVRYKTNTETLKSWELFRDGIKNP